MAESARLSVTLPMDKPNNSSQHSSLTSTDDSDDWLHRPGPSSYDIWLGPCQDARHHISDHQAPASSGSTSPALPQGNSNIENSPRQGSPRHDSIQNSETGTMESLRSSSCENFVSAQGYSRFTTLPQYLRNFQPGKLLNEFWDHPHFRSETVLPRSTSASMFNLWKWEIINCVLAIGMLGSMFGILRRYDNQRIPDWGNAINLSTLVALMGTVLRAMLGFVVAEIIGQSKWKYFAGNGRPTRGPPIRRLREISRFNDASQGLIGAMRLLPIIIRDPATLLAILVIIISFGTGSFVQQAIQTRSCRFPMDGINASLPISRNITSTMVRPLDSPNVLAAISSALAPDNEELGSPISVGCPTGNCTFQNWIGGLYSTMGVCSLCTDTSSLIESTGWTTYNFEPTHNPSTDYFGVTPAIYDSTANYTLPNGMSITAEAEFITRLVHTTELLTSASFQPGLDWAGDLVSPEMKAASEWAFANVTILTSNWVPTSSGYTDYVAATCTLHPCLRSYNASVTSVTSGKLNEVLVSTVPAVPNVAAVFEPNITNEAILDAMYGDTPRSDLYLEDPVFYHQAVQSPCLANGTVWTKADQSFTFETQRLLLLHADTNPSGARNVTIENITAPAECIYGMDGWAFGYFMDFMNTASFNGTCSASSVNDTENTTKIDCGATYWLSRFYSDDGITAASIIERIEAFTGRLSNKLRMGLLNNPEAVPGQVLQATVCSRIDYSWLAFPAVLVAVTSGLLAWTMFQSSRRRGREMVWKTSILPFLFYGERFIVQNGEDMSGHSAESSRRDGPKEPLLDLNQMEAEARQRVVQFDVFS